MSKLDYKNTMPRFMVIVIVMALLGILIIGKVFHTMTVKRPYWEKVSSQLSTDSIDEPAQRGNILSCDGQLMASTLPEYRVYMDYKAGGARKSAMLEQVMDTLCDELHRIFPTQSADEFRTNISEGYRQQKQHKALWPNRIDYNTLQELKKLPLLRLSRNHSGFTEEGNAARKHPFDQLAIRTLGNIYGDLEEPRKGLEEAFDSVLRGHNGLKRRTKVRDQILTTTVREPVNGCDIVTTLDVNMQDIAERSLREELIEVEADVGVAIIMEVATGDIKAMVNLDRRNDGTYSELYPHAIADLMEPGSVFKTASILLALDEEKIDTTNTVDCMGGRKTMYGAEMRDANWTRGGYGILKVPDIIKKSSNIGVSTLIDRAYRNDPQAFVDGLHRIGIGADLQLPLPGYQPPKILGPKDRENAIKAGKKVVPWSKTDLPWMSIGYVTQVPPISTITFYNAIANNGKMMRPRIVKEIRRDGKVVEELKPQVMIDRIAKEDALNKMRAMLEKVVSKTGTGKNAMSEHFKVAGKTGTAQIAGGGGYRKGVMRYLLSFCGYFPADNPRYTCIVCIQKNYGGSGGVVSGKVFHNIAEGIMAQDVVMKKKSANELKSPGRLVPDVKRGNLRATDIVLTNLGFTTSGQWQQTPATNPPVMGTATYSNKAYNLQKSAQYQRTMMPNVVGMGARDALYLLEQRGLKVKLEGRGRVIEQSVPAGDKVKRKQTVTLRMG